MVIVAFIFILLGIVIKHGKMYFLIAGYNTMSKEEKAKYDIEGIATLFRNVMFAMALLIIVGYFAADWFKNPKLETIALFLSILLGVPYLLIRSNSNKYKIDKTKTE